MDEDWSFRAEKFGNLWMTFAYPPEGRKIIVAEYLGSDGGRQCLAHVNINELLKAVREAVLE